MDNVIKLVAQQFGSVECDTARINYAWVDAQGKTQVRRRPYQDRHNAEIIPLASVPKPAKSTAEYDFSDTIKANTAKAKRAAEARQTGNNRAKSLNQGRF